MPNVRLILEYNGKGFHGWQTQPGLRTIETELLRALRIVLREDIGPLYVSGRTDSGVHARGQVVNFFVAQNPDLLRLMRSVSSLLRGELAVRSAEIVPEDFHARKSALSKQYSYTLYHAANPPVLERGQAWYVGAKLDILKMQSLALECVGTHDFTSFRGHGCMAKSAVRTIFESEISWEEPYLRYRVVGQGFLKQMVRNIVGTLVELGRERLALPSISEVLAAKDRRAAGPTAPAHGLCLDWVRYA